MRPRSKSIAASAALLVALIAGAALAGGPLPALEGGDLGQGPYATMHMLLQKTVLNINVATIDVRFDKGTQGRFAQLAGGKAYAPDLGHQLARVRALSPLATLRRGYAVLSDADGRFWSHLSLLAAVYRYPAYVGLAEKRVESASGIWAIKSARACVSACTSALTPLLHTHARAASVLSSCEMNCGRLPSRSSLVAADIAAPSACGHLRTPS